MGTQEKNTVVLSLDEYNELRDFKIGIQEGNTLVIYDGRHSYYENIYYKTLEFVSTDEAVKRIAEENAVLLSKLKELHKEKEPEEKIKRMSVREFRKWRRQ